VCLANARQSTCTLSTWGVVSSRRCASAAALLATSGGGMPGGGEGVCSNEVARNQVSQTNGFGDSVKAAGSGYAHRRVQGQAVAGWVRQVMGGCRRSKRSTDVPQKRRWGYGIWQRRVVPPPKRDQMNLRVNQLREERANTSQPVNGNHSLAAGCRRAVSALTWSI